MNNQDSTLTKTEIPADGPAPSIDNPSGEAVEAAPQLPPPASDGDLRAQARKLRQTQSTADIILEDKAPLQSRRTIIYLSIAAFCALVLLFLFLSPGPRGTLENRVEAIARKGSGDGSTIQAAVPENAYQPPADTPAKPLEGPFTIGPAPAGTSATPSPGATPALPPTPIPAPAPRPAAVRAPASASPTPIAPPPKPRPQGPLSADKQAYQVLMEARPAFQSMVEGTSAEYRFRDYTTTQKTDTIYVLNFTFQRGNLAEAVNYIWEVNTALRTVRPIGLAATRLDRQVPRIQDGTGR